MLHTDAFNKSNKRKMTKADYIKNTQLAGIYPEVLEVRKTCVATSSLISPL
jgi:Sec7-like guanine-nucleotide exchange factor